MVQQRNQIYTPERQWGSIIKNGWLHRDDMFSSKDS